MQVDVAIVGAGVVGLACAAELARRGRSVVVLERNARVGMETSSRNSEVIHAGLYYPSGSLKAETCVRGRELLYARCARHGIAHRRTGKLIVALEQTERPRLQALMQQGLRNGAGELRMLEADEARRLEPRVRCCAALLSPETGIVDAHALVESYRREALAHGADVALYTRVDALAPHAAGWELVCQDAAHGATRLRASWVVNAAGLQSDHIAAACGVDLDRAGLRLHPCKGDYFTLHARLRDAVTHLIYPLPGAAGLGIHLTLDLQGQLRAGPDARYVQAPTYEVDAAAQTRFARSVQRYFPELQADDLAPGYAGVRPKLQGPGESFRDFALLELPEAPRAVHLIGIESPGLTAAGALAERVAQHIE